MAKKAAKKTTAKQKTATPRSKASTKRAPALPKVGSAVQWKALPGMVQGKVTAILTQDTELNGKTYRASPDAPKLQLQSTNGKTCIHKPENVSKATHS